MIFSIEDEDQSIVDQQPLEEASQSDSWVQLPSSQISTEADSLLSLPPIQLQRTNLGRYVLFDQLHAQVFLDWWTGTTHGQRDLIREKHKIKWLGPKISKKWASFDQAAHVTTGEPAVRCRHCSKMLNHPHNGNTGTTNMGIHINSTGCHRNRRGGVQSDLLQMLNSTNSSSNIQMPSSAFSQTQWNQKLADTLISLNASFRTVENEDFRTLLTMLNPQVEIPRRSKVRQLISDQYNIARSSILRDLQGDNKVSLALDSWTSPNKLAFLSVTAYVITPDWQYREHLIGFEKISGAHTGETLAGITIEVLKAFNIEDRLFAITADNASNNVTLRRDLARRLQQDHDMPWDANRHTVPCLAHVVQLVVREMIEHMKIEATNDAPASSLDDTMLSNVSTGAQLAITIKKIRAIAVAVSASPQRLERFKAIQTCDRPLNLIQDVRTRWNSTFNMLLRAYTLRSKIATWLRRETDAKLSILRVSGDEWSQVQCLVRLLAPFKLWTEILSKSSGVTIHKAWFIYNLVTGHLLRLQNTVSSRDYAWKREVSAALEKGLQKLIAYRGKATSHEALIYTLGAVLDPATRLDQFQNFSGINPSSTRLSGYKQQFKSFFNRYYAKYEGEKPTNSAPTRAAVDLVSLSKNARQHYRYSSDQSELGRYFNEPSSKQDDPLKAWKEEETDFPALSRMARDILAVPISGVGVERTFNMARDVCNYRRGHLSATTIKQIMIIKHHRQVYLQDEYSSSDCQEEKDTEENSITQSEAEAASNHVSELECLDYMEGADEEAGCERSSYDFVDPDDLDLNSS